MQKRRTRIVMYFVLLVLFLVLVLPGAMEKWNLGNLPGSRDFIHYYAAAKLFLRGENPYNLEALREIGAAMGREDTDPDVQWIYPSWVLPAYLVLLAPAALLPFSGAVIFWGVVNLILLCAAGAVVWTSIRGRFSASLAPFVLLSSIFFVPAFDSIVFGQITIVIAFGMASFMYFSKKSNDWLASFFLLLPASKPTVWYLLIPFLGWWVLKNKRWKIPIAFTLFILLFSFLGELQVPGLFTYWLDALPYSHAHIMKFRNPTLVDLVNNALFKINGETAMWPEIVIPALMACLLVIYLLVKKPSGDLFPLIFPVLMLSVATAPYCWFFDQVALVTAQVAILAYFFDEQVPFVLRRRIVVLLLFFQICTFASTILLFDDQFSFWWYPWGLLAIWLYAQSLLGRSVSDQSSLS